MSKEMSSTSASRNKKDRDHNGDKSTKELLDLIPQLPKAKGWFKSGSTLYQDCWFPSNVLANAVSFQREFEPQDGDIILASIPKSGTTWLKSLLFSILNRSLYTPSDTPLLSLNPHLIVPSFEYTLFCKPPIDDLSQMTSPRLISTHMPYASLKGAIGDARVVYVCRNPLDTISSFWHFAERGFPMCHDTREWSIDDCVDAFCSGESWFGPFWDHVLGFWKASMERPEKVLFLTYEEMLEDTCSHVKKIGEFLGFPFSPEEESSGVVENIIELCSLKSLKELDVNKHGKLPRSKAGNELFFRRGEVGDWANHLSPSMVERVKKITEKKFSGSSLMFKYLA